MKTKPKIDLSSERVEIEDFFILKDISKPNRFNTPYLLIRDFNNSKDIFTFQTFREAKIFRGKDIESLLQLHHGYNVCYQLCMLLEYSLGPLDPSSIITDGDFTPRFLKHQIDAFPRKKRKYVRKKE